MNEDGSRKRQREGPINTCRVLARETPGRGREAHPPARLAGSRVGCRVLARLRGCEATGSPGHSGRKPSGAALPENRVASSNEGRYVCALQAGVCSGARVREKLPRGTGSRGQERA